MKKPPLTAREIQHLKARYQTLASQIGSFDALSQGSVMPQPPTAWRWTRKVRGKTVSVGLTPERAQRMKLAIANHRALDAIIDEMREITQTLILRTPETAENAVTGNRPKPRLT
jgi:hypothetical protein